MLDLAPIFVECITIGSKYRFNTKNDTWVEGTVVGTYQDPSKGDFIQLGYCADDSHGIHHENGVKVKMSDIIDWEEVQ